MNSELCLCLLVHRLPIVSRPAKLPRENIDVVADELDRAIAVGRVHAARMQTASGKYAIGPVVRAAGAAGAARGRILPVRRGSRCEAGMIGRVPGPIATVIAEESAARQAP